jgi:DNA-binding CsgD family transcriptional regulator
MARGKAVEIVLTDSEREALGQRVRRRKIGRADAMRAEIVLLAVDGLNNCAIAEELGISRLTVGTWRRRFAGKRLGNVKQRKVILGSQGISLMDRGKVLHSPDLVQEDVSGYPGCGAWSFEGPLTNPLPELAPLASPGPGAFPGGLGGGLGGGGGR